MAKILYFPTSGFNRVASDVRQSDSSYSAEIIPLPKRSFNRAAISQDLGKPAALTERDYRAIGDIQYTLIASGLSKDTGLRIGHDSKTGIANALTLSSDIVDPDMHAILGRSFSLSVSKYESDNGSPFYIAQSVMAGHGKTIFEALRPLVHYMNTNAREPRQKVSVLGL